MKDKDKKFRASQKKSKSNRYGQQDMETGDISGFPIRRDVRTVTSLPSQTRSYLAYRPSISDPSFPLVICH
jgi:hypothetical protein